jgi:hypothetical protein
MKSSLLEIQKELNRLAKKIFAPESMLPTLGHSIDGGHEYIDIDENGNVVYAAIERGKEYLRFYPKDMADLMFSIFRGVTASMASDYTRKNKIKGQDSRRIYFFEQERLMGILDETWKEEIFDEHVVILEKNPFDDFASERAIYYQKLISCGQTKGDEWLLACEKYPLPIK